MDRDELILIALAVVAVWFLTKRRVPGGLSLPGYGGGIGPYPNQPPIYGGSQTGYTGYGQNGVGQSTGAQVGAAAQGIGQGLGGLFSGISDLVGSSKGSQSYYGSSDNGGGGYTDTPTSSSTYGDPGIIDPYA